jgi:hypothetical protein
VKEVGVGEEESVTVIVKGNVPLAVGVPESTPVDVLKIIPGGGEPEIEKV